MCSACAGDYENPDMTAAAVDPGRGRATCLPYESPHLFDTEGVTHDVAPISVTEAGQRLLAAIDQLERLERLELDILREAVQATRLTTELCAELAAEAAER